MIKINGVIQEPGKFPDGSQLLKPVIDFIDDSDFNYIHWLYESDEELVRLVYYTHHLRELERIYNRVPKPIQLYLPYVPNARMDRVKEDDDVFTLKYFAEIINSLGFYSVVAVDPHSNVCEALINNFSVIDRGDFYKKLINQLNPDLIFYPDEGAMKRYSSEIKHPYIFGIKSRDWNTGKIKGVDVHMDEDMMSITGKSILIIDDICSKGGTFYHSAKKLKEMGAGDIYLYITHCENTILEGELINSGLIKHIYTTDTIFTKEHPLISILDEYRFEGLSGEEYNEEDEE